MLNIVVFFTVSLINVCIHVFKNILVIKQGKIMASIANGLCYTFSAVYVKFVADSSYSTAMIIAFTTNTLGCYLAMWIYEKWFDKKKND